MSRKELGTWLAAEPFRTHFFEYYGSPVSAVACLLEEYDEAAQNFTKRHRGEGPTEDAAIAAALKEAK